jgi:hypothetical protein
MDMTLIFLLGWFAAVVFVLRIFWAVDDER